MIFSFKIIDFMKIWKTSDFSPKRQEIAIPDIKILKISMLTHVCGVVRGPVGSHHMVRSTLCVHLPWGSLRPIFNFCNLGYRKLSWWWILGFVSSCCLLYVSNLRFAHSYKNQWSMLYKMLQTRILDSRYKIGANLQTELSKNDENDEKFNFFWYSQNQSGIIPESKN